MVDLNNFDYSKMADTAFKKADETFSKWVDNKINFGTNYAKNFIRQYDKLGVLGLENVWTIFDEEGKKAFDFDVFVSANISTESKVAQAPVEQGSFIDYNIAVAPLNIQCVLQKRGFPEELSTTVDALLDYVKSTKLVSLITPEKEYESLKIVKVSFDRSSDNGVDAILADIILTEVRQVETEYTSVKLAKRVQRGKQSAKETSALSGALSWLKG